MAQENNSIENLRRLIDSGKRENIEIAANMSMNLPDEWQWLHRCAIAKYRLPPQYPSWYALYSECVKYNVHTVKIPRLTTFSAKQNTAPVSSINKDYEWVEMSMFEINENVSLEIHFLFSANNRYELISENQNMRRLNQMDRTLITKTKELASRIIDLLPKRT